MLVPLRLYALLGSVLVFVNCGASNAHPNSDSSTPPNSQDSGHGPTATTGDGGTIPIGTGPCALSQPAFCDKFDTPSPGGRAGDLDDSTWSAARVAAGEANNVGQGAFNAWPATTTSACGMTKAGVEPDQDMFFCAGGPTPSMHFNDSYNDGGGFDVHSWRIRQPFDFANRTGIVSFDVAAKAQTPTGHGWWMNVFLSAQPVPVPYQQGNEIALYVTDGIGFEFEGALDCGVNDASLNGLSTVYIEHNYAIVSKITPQPNQVCFKTSEEVMNHIEIHISQTQIDVYGSDAGDPNSFRSLFSASNLSIPFSRAYASFQHTHYNANKQNGQCPGCMPNPGDTGCNCPLTTAYTTYHWDNIGFDGPVLPTPRGYEIPDTLLHEQTNAPFPGTQTGYLLGASGMVTVGGSPPIAPIALAGVDLTNATDAALTLNAANFVPGDTIGYRFNGGTWESFPHPFPTSDIGARAVLIPVPLTDLVQGTNTLEMKSSSGGVIISNAELTVSHT